MTNLRATQREVVGNGQTTQLMHEQIQVGDTIDALFSDSSTHICKVLSIDGHMVKCELPNGQIMWAAKSVCKIVKKHSN